jgi:hemolysin-activating ACP:hemolysin acyltransferase
MKFHTPLISAPVLNLKAHSETEVFGGATWLALHAQFKRERPLVCLNEWLTPAIETKQYLFISDEVDGQHRPIMFLNWGNLRAEILNPSAILFTGILIG